MGMWAVAGQAEHTRLHRAVASRAIVESLGDANPPSEFVRCEEEVTKSLLPLLHVIFIFILIVGEVLCYWFEQDIEIEMRCGVTCGEIGKGNKTIGREKSKNGPIARFLE